MGSRLPPKVAVQATIRQILALWKPRQARVDTTPRLQDGVTAGEGGRDSGARLHHLTEARRCKFVARLGRRSGIHDTWRKPRTRDSLPTTCGPVPQLFRIATLCGTIVSMAIVKIIEDSSDREVLMALVEQALYGRVRDCGGWCGLTW